MLPDKVLNFTRVSCALKPLRDWIIFCLCYNHNFSTTLEEWVLSDLMDNKTLRSMGDSSARRRFSGWSEIYGRLVSVSILLVHTANGESDSQDAWGLDTCLANGTNTEELKNHAPICGISNGLVKKTKNQKQPQKQLFLVFYLYDEKSDNLLPKYRHLLH